MGSAAVMVIFAFVLEYLIYANLFYSRDVLFDRNSQKKQGSFKTLSMSFKLMAIFIFPVAEELLFRGSILKLSKTDLDFWLFLFCVLSINLVWVLLHISNKIKFANGHEEPIPNLRLLKIAQSGLVFTVLTLITGSLWPAIILHATWNLSLLFDWIHNPIIKIASFGRFSP